MASKASMLKQGARKTGTGLFQGMKPLSAAAEKEEKKVVETVKEEPEEVTKEPEPVKTKASAPKAENTKPEVKKEEKKEAPNPVIEQVEEADVRDTITEDIKKVTEEVNKKPVQNHVEEIAAEPAQNEGLQQFTQQPQGYVQPVADPVNSYMNQHSAQPVQTYVQPQEQPIQYAQMPQYAQPIMNQSQTYMNQPVVQPQYSNQYAPYQQAAATVSQPARRGRAAANTGEKNSRYEKDKFLLLDIRGYRDYVEHMAKAANMSATKYIRSLIEQDMMKNMDIYQAHKELEERLRGRQ